MRKLRLAIAFLALFACSSAVSANDDGMMDGDWHGYTMHGWNGGVFGWIMWIILMVLFGLVIYLILKGNTARIGGTPRDETPMEILKKRYARGEITEEEFKRMKNDLG